MSKENKWISVKERLPQDNQKVKCKGMTIGNFKAAEYQAKYIDESFIDEKGRTIILTEFWQPLPNPPK